MTHPPAPCFRPGICTLLVVFPYSILYCLVLILQSYDVCIFILKNKKKTYTTDDCRLVKQNRGCAPAYAAPVCIPPVLPLLILSNHKKTSNQNDQTPSYLYREPPPFFSPPPPPCACPLGGCVPSPVAREISPLTHPAQS